MIAWFHFCSISLNILHLRLTRFYFNNGHYAGVETDQPLEEKDVPYEVDQLAEEQDVPYQVSRIIGSCSGLERGGSFAESLDASTQGKPREA